MTHSLWRRITRFLSGGRTQRDLAESLDLPLNKLRAVEIAYRTFLIRKRGGGDREINAPFDELKRIQRLIHRRILGRLRAHEAATAFEAGRSIVDNAVPHVGAAVIIRLDLVDFFPSIKQDRVARMFRRCGWGRGAARLLAALCSRNGVLPQGAPTSPRLSNLVNIYLDDRLQSLATSYGATYTRYADDITFSLPADDGRKVRALMRVARRVIRSEGYAIHHRKKVSIRRAHQRQMVTGLVVNSGVRLPRETRRWLRAVKHRLERRGSCTQSRRRLSGWLAYERMVEAPK